MSDVTLASDDKSVLVSYENKASTNQQSYTTTHLLTFACSLRVKSGGFARAKLVQTLYFAIHTCPRKTLLSLLSRASSEARMIISSCALAQASHFPSCLITNTINIYLVHCYLLFCRGRHICLGPRIRCASALHKAPADCPGTTDGIRMESWIEGLHVCNRLARRDGTHLGN
jgi:hypothetical protein